MADTAALVHWATAHGATLHPAVEIYPDPTTGLSLRVKPAHTLPAGATVVSCPAALTLSFLNTLPDTPHAAHPPLPAALRAHAPPHVLARFLLVQQFLRGPRSFWHAYLRTLPAPAADVATAPWALPPFWSDADRALLAGTNAGWTTDATRARVRAEYRVAHALLPDDADRAQFSEALDIWAFCILSSRSFRPSLVLGDALRVLPAGVQPDDFTVLQPLLDLGNHSPRAQVAWEVGAGACAWVVREAVGAGQQVFNNYGPKTNSELLLAYGFTLPASSALHNDYVHVRRRGAATDFLLALRPLADASSVVGQIRQWLPPAGPGHAPRRAQYAHVEDRLVWDVVCAQTTAAERARLFPVDGSVGEMADMARLAMVLTHTFPPATDPELLRARAQLLYQLTGEIYNKAGSQMEQLEAGADALEAALEGCDELSERQQAAVENRTACVRVLEAVMEAVERGMAQGDDA